MAMIRMIRSRTDRILHPCAETVGSMTGTGAAFLGRVTRGAALTRKASWLRGSLGEELAALGRQRLGRVEAPKDDEPRHSLLPVTTRAERGSRSS